MISGEVIAQDPWKDSILFIECFETTKAAENMDFVARLRWVQIRTQPHAGHLIYSQLHKYSNIHFPIRKLRIKIHMSQDYYKTQR